MRSAGHKASLAAAADQVASMHPHALASVDLATKLLRKFIEMPIYRHVAAGMLDPHAIATVRAGTRDSVGGGVNVGADRLIGEVKVVGVVAVVLNTAAAEVVDHKAIVALAGVDGREHMVEIGQMHHARAGRPGTLQKAAGRRRLRLLLLGQLVVKILLERLSEAIECRAPVALVAAFRQEALDRHAFGRLL